MAVSRLPKLRGLAGTLALIGALLFVLLLAPSAARAAGTAAVLYPSVAPTAQSAVPAGAVAAISASAAAGVPAAAAAVEPSSAAAAVPAGADGGAIASQALSAVHTRSNGSAGSAGGPGAAAGGHQPDPAPVTAAQPVPTDAQNVIPQAQAAPGSGGTITALKPPTPDKPGSARAAGGHKTSTSGSSRPTGRHQPPGPGPVTVRAPAPVASSAPTLPLRPVVSHPSPGAPNTTAVVKKGPSADRRSRSPKPAAVDVSTPTGGLVPASDAVPPAGAGAGGIGTGVGAGAATLMALVALSLLGTLLPGLLGLEIGPWRSADYAMRLERPG
jgi:hypothetical protein